MVLRRMLCPRALDRLFEEYAKSQYLRSLLFSSLVRLICGVVLSKHASVNAGYKKMKERLDVSNTAVYEKAAACRTVGLATTRPPLASPSPTNAEKRHIESPGRKTSASVWLGRRPATTPSEAHP
jgi:hypothetical protein